jgi:hypothetical protein
VTEGSKTVANDHGLDNSHIGPLAIDIYFISDQRCITCKVWQSNLLEPLEGYGLSSVHHVCVREGRRAKQQ